MARQYLLEIGSATEKDIRFALSLFLLHRFRQRGEFKFETVVSPEGKAGSDYVAELIGQSAKELRCSHAVVATIDVLFGDIDLERRPKTPGPDPGGATAFWKRMSVSEHVSANTLEIAIENEDAILAEIKQLSEDNRLCAILSGAAYNISYARYLKAGGSRGIFSNHFLSYVRTLFSASDIDFSLKMASKIGKLENPNILKPFDGLQRYGLLQPLPTNPDERAYYKAVREFAEEMAALEKTQKVTQEKPQEVTPEYRERVVSEYADGYPTRETLAEFLEAHKKGGDAITALLRKREAALKQAKESTSDD